MAKKRTIKTLAAVLTAILSTVSLVSCKKQEIINPKDNGAKVITTTLLNSFSNEKDLYQVLLFDGYGKMTLNKDEAYYESGKGSAKLELSNDNGLPMIFKQRLKSQVNGYDYTDFSQAKGVKTSIYNGADEEVEVVFALEFSDATKSAIKKFTLSKGWNQLYYAVDREMLALQFDITKTMYLTYTFESKETPYTVYVDEISLEFTNSQMQEVTQTIEQNEICSFDKNYQMSAFSLFTYSTIRMGYFTGFGLTADADRVKNGQSFYVTVKKGLEDKGSSYMLRLNPKYGERIDWQSVTANDYLHFWVYNEGPAIGIQVRFNNKKGQTLMDVNNSPSATATNLKAYDWTEVKIPFSAYEKLAKEKNYLEEGETIGDIITTFDVLWGAFDNVPQKTLYFDEFSIVKGDA